MGKVQRSIQAVYRIETAFPPEEAAKVLAGEQSSGTFVPVPGESDELKERHGAVVESVVDLGDAEGPAYPGAKTPKGETPEFRRAEIRVSWPFDNIGVNLPVLLSTLAGGVYDLSIFSGIKLLDVELPEEYSRVYSGPAFGIEGTRKLTGVFGRPIIGSIIKPCIGLPVEETAAQVEALVEGGIDFIKDDEVLCDPPYAPFAERVKAVTSVIDRYADRTGKRVMYAFNVSGDLDDMKRRHDIVVEHGGICIMANVLSVGFAGLDALRRHSRLPIHGHRCGFGALNRSPLLGMEFRAYHKFWRLLGIDHIHTNGLRNKFYESDDSVVRSIRACYEPLHGGNYILPVLGSGQWAGQAVDTYRAVGSDDVLYLCGGGILAHPSGIRAGVQSVVQAWQAAKEGKSIEEYAARHRELREAVEFFGRNT